MYLDGLEKAPVYDFFFVCVMVSPWSLWTLWTICFKSSTCCQLFVLCVWSF